MRMDDAVIDLHRFLGTFNTMEIKHISLRLILFIKIYRLCIDMTLM